MNHSHEFRYLNPTASRCARVGYGAFFTFLMMALAAFAQAETRGGTVQPIHPEPSALNPAGPPAPTRMASVAPTQSAKPLRFIKGGNVSAWNITDVAKVFADAQRLGLNTITVPVRVNMASAGSSEVKIDEPSLKFAQRIVESNTSYSYIIEPYPWINNGNVPETDLDPVDKAAWFTSYQAALVALVKHFPTAWGMYVASNLVKVEGESNRWISLIRNVRAAFPGKIIYRTQWWVTADWEPGTIKAYQAKLNNPIFGAVDVIGIASYFELTEATAPTVEQIKAALRSTTVFDRKQDVFTEVMALNARWNKPIFLGELGCPALDLGAQTPWDPAIRMTRNAEIQKNYLSAYLETFPQDRAKFLGFSLFTIGHPTVSTYDLAPSAVNYVRAFKPQVPPKAPLIPSTEAVDIGPVFIPSIFVMSDGVQHDAQRREMTISIGRPHGLVVGDQVQIAAEKTRIDKTVVAVPSATRFVLGEVEQPEVKVFVIGKRVNHVHGVSYEDLVSMGLGIIQEFSKQNDALRRQNDALKVQVATEQRINDLQQVEIEAIKAHIAAILARLGK